MSRRATALVAAALLSVPLSACARERTNPYAVTPAPAETADAAMTSTVRAACERQLERMAAGSVGGKYKHTATGFELVGHVTKGSLLGKAPRTAYNVPTAYVLTSSTACPSSYREACRYHPGTGSAEFGKW